MVKQKITEINKEGENVYENEGPNNHLELKP